MKIVSGIQATNSLTLGNYVGAIKSFIELQKENELFIFIADYHSITNDFEPNKLNRMRMDVAKIYLASGIDGDQAIIFNQSDVAEHLELSWILTCHTNLGQLYRMTQFKDKAQKKELNGTTRIPTGLLIYPVLMASDILIYSPDIVPVGKDQKQHIELTRDIANNFNSKYKTKTFKIPEFYSSKTGNKIMDLQNPEIKMSKSNEKEDGTIFLLEDLNKVRKKIMSAKTDMLNKVNFDVENQPGISNLLSIYSSLENLSIDKIIKKFESSNYKDFKIALSNIVCSHLEKIQNNYHNLKDEKVIQILDSGAKKARAIAQIKINEVKKIIGL